MSDVAVSDSLTSQAASREVPAEEHAQVKAAGEGKLEEMRIGEEWEEGRLAEESGWGGDEFMRTQASLKAQVHSLYDSARWLRVVGRGAHISALCEEDLFSASRGTQVDDKVRQHIQSGQQIAANTYERKISPSERIVRALKSMHLHFL